MWLILLSSIWNIVSKQLFTPLEEVYIDFCLSQNVIIFWFRVSLYSCLVMSTSHFLRTHIWNKIRKPPMELLILQELGIWHSFLFYSAFSTPRRTREHFLNWGEMHILKEHLPRLLLCLCLHSSQVKI